MIIFHVNSIAFNTPLQIIYVHLNNDGNDFFLYEYKTLPITSIILNSNCNKNAHTHIILYIYFARFKLCLYHE